MSRMATTVLLVIVLHSLVAAASAQQQQPPVARPGCNDTCGNITIPYPFGIGPGCYRDDGLLPEGFELMCNDSASPPRLTTVVEGYRLGALSLTAGEATTYISATSTCYNSTGSYIGGNSTGPMDLEGTPFLFSSTKTQLVALGCPTLGYFVDSSAWYVSGCMSVCRPAQYKLPGSCTGTGCCRSLIPSGVNYYRPIQNYFTQEQYNFETIAALDTSCTYMFLVETEWFDSDRVVLNRTDDFEVPIVLDWAIRNSPNCSAARRNATGFACRDALSECVDSTNGAGYRCNCPPGYNGNPFLDNGCTDIDECKNPEAYPCYGVCINMPGTFHCRCHDGTYGDPLVKGCDNVATIKTEGKLDEIIDPQVMEEEDGEGKEVATLAAMCTQLKGEDRPTMREVEMKLENLRVNKMLVAPDTASRRFVGDKTRPQYMQTEGAIVESSRQYTMEEEILISARYPR